MKRNALLVLTLLFFAAATAFAGPMADIKQRMKERLPRLLEMKAAGIVGENNKGYLEYVSAEKPDQGVVNAENADRRTVYAAIAAQQGVDIETVGKRRAIQIAENIRPGEYVQDAAGAWVKR